MTGKWIRYTGWGFAILIVLCITALTATNRYIQSRHFHLQVQHWINDRIAGHITWQPSLLSLPRAQIVLDSVHLSSAQNETIATTKRLKLKWSWRSLLDGEILVDEFALEKPSLDWRHDPDGGANLVNAVSPTDRAPAATDKSAGGSAFNLIVKHLNLQQGTLRFFHASSQADVALTGIDLAADGNWEQRFGTLKLFVSGGSVETPQVLIPLDHVDLRAELNRNRAASVALQAHSDGFTVNLSGTIDSVFDAPVCDLTGVMETSLAEIGRALRLSPEPTGRAHLKLTVSGALDNPRARLLLDYDGGEIFGHRIDHTHANMRLDDRLVRVDDLAIGMASGNLRIKGDMDLQTAFPDGIIDPRADWNRAGYWIDWQMKDVHLSELSLPIPTAAGIVDSHGSVSGKGLFGQDFSATGNATVNTYNLTTDSTIHPVDANLQSRFSFDQQAAIFHEFIAEAQGIRMEGHGEYHWESHALKAQITLDAPDLGRTLPALGLGDIQGSLQMNARAAGTLHQPLMDLNLAGEDVRFQHLLLGDVSVDAGLGETGELRIDDLHIENQGSHLRGSGRIQLRQAGDAFNADAPLDLSIRLADIEAHDFVGHNVARGQLDGYLEMVGTLRSPKGRLVLTGKDLGVHAVEIGDAHAVMHFQGDTLQVEHLVFSRQEASLQVTGSAKLLDPRTREWLVDPPLNVTLVAEGIRAQNFSTALEGTFSGKADLKGSLRTPRGPVHIAGQAIVFHGQPVQSAALNAQLEANRLEVQGLDIFLGADEKITARGTLSLKDFSNITVTTDGISLAGIKVLQTNTAVEGVLSGSVEGSGVFDNPTLNGRLTVSDLRVAGKSLGDLALRLDIIEQLARGDARLADARLDASYHLATGDLSGHLALDVHDLTPYATLAGIGKYGGALSAEVDVRGNAAAPKSIEGEGRLGNVRVTFDDREILQTQDARFLYHNQKLVIPGWELTLLKKGRLRFVAAAGMDGSIEADARGSVPLEVARGFIKAPDDLKGEIDLVLSARGSRDDPGLEGTIDLRAVSLTLPGLKQRLENLNGRLEVTPQKITIRALNARVDSGHLDLAGTIGIHGLQPGSVDLQLKARDLPLSMPDTFETVLASRLALKGSPGASSLSGEIVIQEGVYTKDLQLNLMDMINQGERRNIPPPKEITLPFLKDLELDVHVTRRQPFVVDNNLALLEISPDLHFAGTLNRPRVKGRAVVDQGTVFFRGRQFEIVRGAVDFVNPYKIEPYFDIRGQVEIRHWQVFLDVTGPADGLIFELSSQPTEEQSDILALILMGQTTRELASGEGAGRSQTASQLMALLANSQFGGDIKNMTGLDIIETETVADQTADAERTRVTIGKNLSERMAVRYGLESMDGRMVQITMVEYRLLERIIASGFQNTQGTYGGALRYRLDFR